VLVNQRKEVSKEKDLFQIIIQFILLAKFLKKVYSIGIII
jgi:hypothetical protein